MASLTVSVTCGQSGGSSTDRRPRQGRLRYGRCAGPGRPEDGLAGSLRFIVARPGPTLLPYQVQQVPRQQRIRMVRAVDNLFRVQKRCQTFLGATEVSLQRHDPSKLVDRYESARMTLSHDCPLAFEHLSIFLGGLSELAASDSQAGKLVSGDQHIRMVRAQLSDLGLQ